MLSTATETRVQAGTAGPGVLPGTATAAFPGCRRQRRTQPGQRRPKAESRRLEPRSLRLWHRHRLSLPSRPAGRTRRQRRVPWRQQRSSLIAVPAWARGSAAAGQAPRPGTTIPGVPRAAPALRAQDAARPARCRARRVPADAAAPAGAPPGPGGFGASRRSARRRPPRRAGPRHPPQLRLPLPPPAGAAARMVRAGAGRAALRPGTARGTGGCVSASSRPAPPARSGPARPARGPCLSQAGGGAGRGREGPREALRSQPARPGPCALPAALGAGCRGAPGPGEAVWGPVCSRPTF